MVCCGQWLQKELVTIDHKLLLITSYNSAYQAGTKFPYILYCTSSKFYTNPRMWRHYGSWPLTCVIAWETMLFTIVALVWCFTCLGGKSHAFFDEVSLNAANLERPGRYCQKRLNQITNSLFILILYFNYSGSPQFLYYSGTYCMFNLSFFTTWNLFYSMPNTYTVKTNWLF